MVTIEQKLLLFSKLINHSMEKKFKEDLTDLEKHHDEIIINSFAEIDKSAILIEERAEKKSETIKTESLSKKNVNIKREVLIHKKKYYYILMEKFKSKIKEFILSDNYKDYLIYLLNNTGFDYENLNIEIYLTESDNKKYSEIIKNVVKSQKSNIEFKNTDNIMGGLIIIDTINNIKMDLSIDSILEDNKTYILKTLFDALEEGGGRE